MLGLSRTNARSASMRSCPIFRSTSLWSDNELRDADAGAGGREGGTCLAVTCMRKKNWCESVCTHSIRALRAPATAPLDLRSHARLTLTPQQTAHATDCTHAQGVRGLACVRSRHPTRPASLSPSPHTPTDASRLPALHASAIARGERARGGLGWLRRRLALHVGVGGAQATTRRRLLGLGARRRRLGWPASPRSLRAG